MYAKCVYSGNSEFAYLLVWVWEYGRLFDFVADLVALRK